MDHYHRARSATGTLSVVMDDQDATPGDVVDLAWAAAYLRISERNAYRLAVDGKLPGAFRIGRSWRVNRRVLESLGAPQEPK